MNPNERMSLEELEQTPEYLILTPKQRLFVATYIQGGADGGQYDAVHAVTVAYNCKNPNSARVMSYSMLGNIRIVATLNRHFNRQPLEAFMMVLDRAIHNGHLRLSQIHALRLKADMLHLPSMLPVAGRTVRDVIDEIHAEERKAPRAPRKPRELPPAPLTEGDIISKRLAKTLAKAN